MDSNEIEKKLDNLSEEEKIVALKILKEYSKDGKSQLYDSLVYEDYREIPVDIETFLTDDKYLGIASKTTDGKLKVYPFWLKQLKKLFPDNIHTSVNTFIASGARGLGKSECCVNYIMTYLLYRDMCLKDVLDYYHLKKTDKVVYSLMNIKLALAQEIAIDKFQSTVKQSPWFMERGVVTGRTNQLWQPLPEYHIDIKIGSQSDDLIGLPIRFCFCLDGDTLIQTELGDLPIKDMVGKNIKVLTKTDNGYEFRDYEKVIPTTITNEEYEVTLLDGTVLKCTENHRFLLTDGSYKFAKDLDIDDDIVEFKPFGYIYKITNKLNNKIYIGKREKPYFDKNYWGSGKYLINAYKKYGKENFIREIICWCPTKEILWEKEKYYIKKYNTQDKNIGYNIGRGGEGGQPHTLEWREKHSGAGNGRYGKPVSLETRQKISEKNLGRGLGVKNPNKGRPGKKKPAGFGAKVSKALTGRKFSAETIEKMSQRQKGYIWINNGSINSKVPGDLKIPNGWVKGQLVTKQHHDLVSKKLKNHKGLKGIENGMYGKKHTDESKKAMFLAKISKSLYYNKKVQCVETNKIYNNIYEASEHTNIPRAALKNCCQGVFKTTHSYHWRFYDEN